MFLGCDMKTILLSESNQIAFIKLNRPDVRNAFDSEMISELTALFKKLQTRNDIRAIGLTGEGKAFCAGADLNWMKSMIDFSLKENKEDSAKLYEMFSALNDLDLPVVAHVHGAVFGGALGLIANCDYVVSDVSTKFCFSEVKLGLAPAVISGFVLEKVQSSAKYYMSSGDIFDAEKAKDMALVNFVADQQAGQLEFQRVLQQYKDNGPEAVRHTKKLLRDLRDTSWSKQKDLTTTLIAQLRVSTEGQEGIKSFLENKKPSWKG